MHIGEGVNTCSVSHDAIETAIRAKSEISHIFYFSPKPHLRSAALALKCMVDSWGFPFTGPVAPWSL